MEIGSKNAVLSFYPPIRGNPLMQLGDGEEYSELIFAKLSLVE
jgi:hypothetical protein